MSAPTLMRLLLIASSLLLLLLRPCLSIETWDVAATVYGDQFCFERIEDVLLMDGTCYSTMAFSNTSVAFRVKIVGFGNRGAKWVVDYQEFSDDCRTPVTAPSSLTVGECVSFLGRFRGQLSVKLRSSRCDGEECSRLAVAEQNFYEEDDCVGDPIMEFRQWVPLQGECIAASNGSVSYVIMPDQNQTRIRRIDYPGQYKCDALSFVEYNVIGRCYALYDGKSPRSFSWTAHRIGLSISSAPSRTGALAWLHLLLLVLVTASPASLLSPER